MLLNEPERLGSYFNQANAKLFNNFIEQTDLVDIPSGGPRCTWSNKWGSKFSKMDRFLVTDGILVHFPRLSSMVLEKKISYHRLILLSEHNVDYGHSPFRVFHYWFDMDGFDGMVRHSWA